MLLANIVPHLSFYYCHLPYSEVCCKDAWLKTVRNNLIFNLVSQSKHETDLSGLYHSYLSLYRYIHVFFVDISCFFCTFHGRDQTTHTQLTVTFQFLTASLSFQCTIVFFTSKLYVVQWSIHMIKPAIVDKNIV